MSNMPKRSKAESKKYRELRALCRGSGAGMRRNSTRTKKLILRRNKIAATKKGKVW